ncbi:MAG: hypothetical protein JXQ23_12945 [Clostridia bacterium]|nr:hypothetical protein [Clostridia bacterium]
MDNVNNQFNKSESSIIKKIKYFVLYALNPVKVLSEEKKHPWYLYLILPAIGWMLFFLQVGLYRGSQFTYSAWKVIFMTVTGLIVGYISVLLISFLLTYLLAFWGVKVKADQVISCLALSHTYMTFSMVLGLLYSIMGSVSPTSFGIAGLMSTLLPIYAGIRTLGKKNVFIAPVLASVVGVLLLAGWQLILYINL